MLVLIGLSAVLLTVVIFAFQNGQAVTVRLFFWELESSLALVTVCATAAGAVLAALVGLARRLWRWNWGRSGNDAAPASPVRLAQGPMDRPDREA